MLMPVHVEREVQLLGRNLGLLQVSVSCGRWICGLLGCGSAVCKPWNARGGLGPLSQPGGSVRGPGRAHWVQFLQLPHQLCHLPPGQPRRQ